MIKLLLLLIFAQVSEVTITNATPDLNKIIKQLTVPNANGDAQVSATIRFPSGNFYLTEPVTYRGSSSYSLRIIGAGSYATRLHYIGDKDWAIKFLGANRSSIEGVEIINEATKPIEQVVWFDATNTDKDEPSRPNNGCWMYDVSIGTMQHSFTKDGVMLRIGREALPTPQISEFRADKLRIVGQDTCTGIGFFGGGNVKQFSIFTAGITHVGRAFDWPGASGVMLVDDISISDAHEVVFRQTGAGQLVGRGWNMEGCGPMLWQEGGNNMMSANITGFEWTGPEKGMLAIRCHGATQLTNGFFQGWKDIPWIEMTYPIRTATAPCSLALDGVWFNKGDDDRLPIRDGSGNKLLHPQSYYKDKPTSFDAKNCFIGTKKIERIGK